MRELFSADWYMLRKHGLIWWMLAVVLCIGVLIIASDAWAVHEGYETDFEDGQITIGSGIAGAAAALICGVALDNAFTEGTIRNKLVTGKSRSQVYWASYLACTTAALLLYAVYALVTLFGQLGIAASDDPANTARYILYAACSIPAYTALYCSVSAMIGRKGIGIACLVIFLVLGIVAIWLEQSLAEPETFNVYDREQQAYELPDDEAAFQNVEAETANGPFRVVAVEPNPNYVAEPARSVYRFFLNVLPDGQSLQLVTEVQGVLPWYSLGFCVLFCGVGVIVMKRRNIS